MNPVTFILHDGECGPNLSRLAASPDAAISVLEAAKLLGVAPLRVMLATGCDKPSAIISKADIERLCETRPGDVWAWQRSYRAMARPAAHAVEQEWRA